MRFDDAFRHQLAALLAWRRDVRHFRTEPLPEGAVRRLIAQACAHAPSVGLSQPWRFVLVDDPARRAAVTAIFARCNDAARSGYDGERAALYASLKLAGLREAPAHVAVFAEPDPEAGHGLGRRSMPETIAYSTVAAIQNLWLLARAEGIGLGWVSILEPEAVRQALAVPDHWRLIAYLCLGWPVAETEIPELERLSWEHRADPDERMFQR